MNMKEEAVSRILFVPLGRRCPLQKVGYRNVSDVARESCVFLFRVCRMREILCRDLIRHSKALGCRRVRSWDEIRVEGSNAI
jgi:hypothetical protein